MKYNNEIIILIEYLEGIPHTVYTEYTTYYFDLYNNSWLMFYSPGGMKNWKEINGEKIVELDFQFCKPEFWQVWIDSSYILIPELQAGVTLLKKPLMLSMYHDETEKHNNPFVVGEEVDEIYYCEKCDFYFHGDGCPEHGYEENK